VVLLAQASAHVLFYQANITTLLLFAEKLRWCVSSMSAMLWYGSYSRAWLLTRSNWSSHLRQRMQPRQGV